MSKTQIDKLGERLRTDSVTEADLALLDEYRRTFGLAYESVVRTIRDVLSLETTGRPAKTTVSIREKLRRESIRLSQIQDIAGCRVVVHDLSKQDQVVERLQNIFPGSVTTDRRVNPSHGYRAVHTIARVNRSSVEVQVRTKFQHAWAELSEKRSDVDPGFKYGGGDPNIRALFLTLSDAIYDLELADAQFWTVAEAVGNQDRTGEERQRLTIEATNLHGIVQLKRDFISETIQALQKALQSNEP